LKIKLINVSKQILTINLEQGNEVHIPPELSQDGVPMTMRFYDPILKIIQQSCSDEKKNYFLLENQYVLKQIELEDMTAKLKNYFGISKDYNKQTFKHSIISEKEQY
jgi:hypothetical protein